MVVKSFDVTEAASCYAVGRDTACVFHLMRALESPVRLLALAVGLAVTDTNWNKILDKIDGMLRDVREGRVAKPADWKEKEAFYNEAAALLRNIKNVRNATAHLERKYTPDEAKRFLNTTEAMMVFLAKHLKEPQT